MISYGTLCAFIRDLLKSIYIIYALRDAKMVMKEKKFIFFSKDRILWMQFSLSIDTIQPKQPYSDGLSYPFSQENYFQ